MEKLQELINEIADMADETLSGYEATATQTSLHSKIKYLQGYVEGLNLAPNK